MTYYKIICIIRVIYTVCCFRKDVTIFITLLTVNTRKNDRGPCLGRQSSEPCTTTTDIWDQKVSIDMEDAESRSLRSRCNVVALTTYSSGTHALLRISWVSQSFFAGKPHNLKFSLQILSEVWSINDCYQCSIILKLSLTSVETYAELIRHAAIQYLWSSCSIDMNISRRREEKEQF